MKIRYFDTPCKVKGYLLEDLGGFRARGKKPQNISLQILLRYFSTVYSQIMQNRLGQGTNWTDFLGYALSTPFSSNSSV